MRKYKTVIGLLGKPERWMKGDYNNKDFTSFCLSGAIKEIYGSDTWEEICKTEEKLLDAICELFPRSRRGIVTFNDAKHRKHKDIVKVLNKARI